MSSGESVTPQAMLGNFIYLCIHTSMPITPQPSIIHQFMCEWTHSSIIHASMHLPIHLSIHPSSRHPFSQPSSAYPFIHLSHMYSRLYKFTFSPSNCLSRHVPFPLVEDTMLRCLGPLGMKRLHSQWLAVLASKSPFRSAPSAVISVTESCLPETVPLLHPVTDSVGI